MAAQPPTGTSYGSPTPRGECPLSHTIGNLTFGIAVCLSPCHPMMTTTYKWCAGLAEQQPCLSFGLLRKHAPFLVPLKTCSNTPQPNTESSLGTLLCHCTVDFSRTEGWHESPLSRNCPGKKGEGLGPAPC